MDVRRYERRGVERAAAGRRSECRHWCADCECELLQNRDRLQRYLEPETERVMLLHFLEILFQIQVFFVRGF
jgi:hypothetical protein